MMMSIKITIYFIFSSINNNETDRQTSDDYEVGGRYIIYII